MIGPLNHLKLLTITIVAHVAASILTSLAHRGLLARATAMLAGAVVSLKPKKQKVVLLIQAGSYGLVVAALWRNWHTQRT